MNGDRVDYRYANLLKYIYENATLQVKINEDWNWITGKIPVRRGIRQGDTISPKLFYLSVGINVYLGRREVSL